MKINRLKLTGYKRIYVTGYQNIDIDFNSKIQLILGMNGSGKSSIMSEISPLPIERSDLNEDGRKEVWISHNGKDYYLMNNKSGQCSFVDCDTDTELNPGGTMPVQKELIKDIFNYTPKTHSLLVGKELFTEMRPMARKEWLMQLSDTNYDYALKVFNRLKEEARDLSGALKLAKNKLAEQISQRADDSNVSALEQEIQALEQRIEQLQTMREQVSDEYIDCHDNHSMLNETAKQIQWILTTRFSGGQSGKASIDWEARVHGLRAEAKSMRERINELGNRIVENQNKIADIRRVSGIDIEILRIKQTELKTQIESARQAIPFPYVIQWTDLVAQKQSIESARQTLDEIELLPENTDERYTPAKYKQLEDTLNKHKIKVSEFRVAQERILNELDHLKQHENGRHVQCPKCMFEFNPDYNVMRVRTLERQLAELNEKGEALRNEDNELNLRYIEESEYWDRMNRILFAINDMADLSDMWRDIREQRMISQQPRMVRQYVRRVYAACNAELTARNAESELVGIEKSIAQYEHSQQINTSGMDAIIQESEAMMQDLLNKEKVLESQLKHAETCLKEVQGLKSLVELAKQQMQRNQSDFDVYLKQMFQKSLTESIRSLQAQLGDLARVHNELRTHRELIRRQEAHIDELEAREKPYKALISSLSPNEGLIAYGLTMFIEHLVKQMNVLIGRVWSYPFEIIPPSFDTDGTADLDYKFPFTILNENRVIPDVSLGSKGQREIIDLAFRVIACRYLHLKDVPIYADEFGTGLDETHRKRAADAIKTIVAEEHFSQLFMISHYEDAHGSLTNADICVLSEENITVPARYNHHVRLT